MSICTGCGCEAAPASSFCPACLQERDSKVYIEDEVVTETQRLREAIASFRTLINKASEQEGLSDTAQVTALIFVDKASELIQSASDHIVGSIIQDAKQ